MAKKMLIFFCIIIFLVSNSIPKMTYSNDEEKGTRSMLRSQRSYYQHTDFNNFVEEDTIQWARSYGGVEDDAALSILQTTNGDYLFAGTTGSWPNDKAWLVKLDAKGNVQWTQTYDFSTVNAIIPTTDGGYALAGTRGGYLGSPSDAWLVKTDARGIIIWDRVYDWKDKDLLRSVIQTSDDGFVLGGSSSYFNEQWNGWLVKTDTDGNKQWNQSYGGSSHDHIHSVIQMATGEFAFAGETWSYGASLNDGWLVTTSVYGEVIWNQTYGGLGSDRIYTVIQTEDGDFILVGATSSYGAGDFDAWFVKTDADGNIEWTRTYGGTAHDNAFSGILTDDGGFALAGATKSYGAGAGDFDFWLVKLDASGAIEWNQTYGGSKDDEANSVIRTIDSGFMLVGRTLSYDTVRLNALVVKTDAWGNAPNITFPQRDWFAVGLLVTLTLTTTLVVIIYVRRYRRSRKFP